jgi:hypothetical protein
MIETISNQLIQQGVLGIAVVAMGVVIFQLWRELQRAKMDGDKRYNDLSVKYDNLQIKYEAVLIELGKMHGKVDTEVSITAKLDQLFYILEKKSP